MPNPGRPKNKRPFSGKKIADSLHVPILGRILQDYSQLNFLKMALSQLFKIKDGLRTQKEQLAEWKQVLNDKAFKTLTLAAKESNGKLLQGVNDGYDVLRGTSLDAVIEEIKCVFRNEENRKSNLSKNQKS